MSVPQYAFFSVHESLRNADFLDFVSRIAVHLPVIASGGTARDIRAHGVEVTPVTELVARSMAHRLDADRFFERAVEHVTDFLGASRQLNGDSVEAIRREIGQNIALKTEVIGRVTDTLVGKDAILGHRVVTLRPEVFGPILAAPNMFDELESLGMCEIKLVCTGFYPLHQAIGAEGATHESIIKETDIGGPSMVMAAVKGERLVVVNPADYKLAVSYFQNPPSIEVVRRFQAQAVWSVIEYYRSLAMYFDSITK